MDSPEAIRVNEHIIIRTVQWLSCCLIRMSVQWFPADVVHYFNIYIISPNLLGIRKNTIRVYVVTHRFFPRKNL
jgi:hypothetical protein